MFPFPKLAYLTGCTSYSTMRTGRLGHWLSPAVLELSDQYLQIDLQMYFLTYDFWIKNCRRWISLSWQGIYKMHSVGLLRAYDLFLWDELFRSSFS